MIAAGLALACALCEISLRVSFPGSAVGAGTECRITRDPRGPLTSVFTIDPEFGFRPVLGNRLYSGYGTLTNAYPAQKRAGVTRLLFVGDSIMARGRVVNALREFYGTNRFEYWNAGVESFNTVQEVRYYLKYNAAIRPDHVILGFHLNDFETTPVAFYDDAGNLVIHAPDVPLDRLNPWLFRHSYLYRFFAGLRTGRHKDRDALAGEVTENLRVLRDRLAADGIAFTVLVFPLFKPVPEWDADERDAAKRIGGILDVLQIQNVNLMPPFEAALAEGIQTQETPGDWWHPGDAVCRRFAEYLGQKGLIRSLPVPDRQ